MTYGIETAFLLIVFSGGHGPNRTTVIAKYSSENACKEAAALVFLDRVYDKAYCLPVK